MAPLTPAIEPTNAAAGSTLIWTVAEASYPVSEGWALSYAFAGRGTLTWSTSYVTNDGSTHTVTIPATITAGLPAGRYEVTRIWTGSGTYAGRVDHQACYPLVLTANPATVGPGDRVSFAEKNLEAVEAAISARLAGDQPVEYTIGGRSVVKMALTDLYATRARLQGELWKARNPGRRRSVSVQFSVPV